MSRSSTAPPSVLGGSRADSSRYTASATAFFVSKRASPSFLVKAVTRKPEGCASNASGSYRSCAARPPATVKAGAEGADGAPSRRRASRGARRGVGHDAAESTGAAKKAGARGGRSRRVLVVVAARRDAAARATTGAARPEDMLVGRRVSVWRGRRSWLFVEHEESDVC